MSILNSKTERKRFLKFAFVGLTGTVVDFGIMNLLRIVVGFPLVWAQGISFAIAVLNNFLWNRLWTYPESRDKGATWQLIQFLIINIIGIVIRTPLISWLDQIILNLLNKMSITITIESYIISQNLALASSISIVMLWNYFANRYWTFRNVPSDEVEC
ncbi:MAG: GtrA family protein [Chloroflexota bacterium]|jgi:putative flippase GtrA|nr:GtrA family protein [Chloroflexota bacterium]